MRNPFKTLEEFSEGAICPNAQTFLFALLRGTGTFLDIDVRLAFVALEKLLKCFSYRLFIALHLGSIDLGKAGLESGEDLCGCMPGSKGGAGAKCQVVNTASVIESGRSRHGCRGGNHLGSRSTSEGAPRCLAGHSATLFCSAALVLALTTTTRGPCAQYYNRIFRIFRVFRVFYL